MTHDTISNAEIEAAKKAWFSVPLTCAEDYTKRMRAAILASRAALLAEERKVVAREPTEVMLGAAFSKSFKGDSLLLLGWFHRMWDAAP